MGAAERQLVCVPFLSGPRSLFCWPVGKEHCNLYSRAVRRARRRAISALLYILIRLKCKVFCINRVESPFYIILSAIPSIKHSAFVNTFLISVVNLEFLTTGLTHHFCP